MRTLSLLLAFASLVAAAEPTKTKKIVLIAGPIDGGHPAGTHEYEKTVRAFKHCLDNASNVKGVKVEAHLKGWPEKPATLDDADTIVIVASGSDRKESDHPLLVGDRLAVIEKQMKRGCGLCLIHWATFMPKRANDKTLDWVGGYFDYESGPAKNGWYSKIQTVTVKALPQKHAITTGMTPFEIKDEFYYNIRFRERDPGLTPILTVPINKEGEQTVAWAVDRNLGEPGGVSPRSRGFGFTGGHFFDNWKNDNFRKMALNAILWTAKVEVPEGGVKSEFPGEREIGLVTIGNPSQVLILTGHDGPFHNWRETSQMLKLVIERDSRLRCRIVTDPEFLAREDLLAYDLIVQNYCNWEKPGLSDEAKKNFLKYLESGRGLAVIHFANGAFHPSLPKAAEGDWPEYRKIVRRVWDHGKGLSGHDAFGKYTVNIAGDHPITAGMNAFETVDELYYKQQGDETLKPLVTAKSKDTKKDEPLAWAYEYGKARVFQTVLGHAAESIKGDGPATLIRRGCAWAANRELSPEKPPLAAKPLAPKLTFVDGKFGKALDVRVLPASIEQDERFRRTPFTIECWAKLNSKTGFNVIVSCEPKSSSQHWEIYSYAASGVFSAYLPGTVQGEIKSNVDICDNKWHHLAMTYTGKKVGLFVDGQQVKEQAISDLQQRKPEPGPLVIGGAYHGDLRIGCDGLIDDVRFSNVVREVAMPKAALERDAQTVSLWNLDGNEGISADTNWTPPVSAGAKEPWELENDKDWVDARFAKTDTGPYLNATIDYEGPKGKVRAYKGTAIKVGGVGDKGEATVLFDRCSMKFLAGWTGGFLNHSSRRFGLLNTPTPSPDAQMIFRNMAGVGWADPSGNGDLGEHRLTAPLPKEWFKYQGLYVHGNRTILGYTVGSTDVLDSPSLIEVAGTKCLVRTLRIGPTSKSETVAVGRLPKAFDAITRTADVQMIDCSLPKKGFAIIACKADPKVATLHADREGEVRLTFGESKNARVVRLVYAYGESIEHPKFRKALEELPAAENPEQFTKAGPARWTKPITTQLEPGKDTGGPFVLDTLPLPYDNPYNALFFVSGVDFLPDGRIAICTAHGDVWTAKEKGTTMEWHRFATGLYQPLGLKVVDGKIVVVERGQLTRLHDSNNDGEADFYECLNNDWHTGGGEHSYDTCLETDPEGNFYFFKTGDDHTPTGGTLLKISKDGSKSEIFATGFRHPIGLGMSPDGKISGADQEGNWMPVTRLDMYKKGGFYGDMRTHHRAEPPKIYDEPLMWLPKEADNSAGGQVWVPKGQWGALGGHMLHLSYGRCKAYAILPDGEKSQAGAVDLGLKFLSGSARGRFHPIDKNLYVVGLDGWQTGAQKDGSLQRVRYTGKPFTTPVAFSVHANGVNLSFNQPIDAKSLADLTNFKVGRCNYVWSANYGSKNWSVLDPKKEGIDNVPVTAATLSEDGKTVTLKFDQRAAMHVKIEYEVKAANGASLKGAVYTTVRETK
ncbi:MAG: hypothetical protein EXS09_11130 [Gemmataceae bacterium]|nr:hypothetical protein [Gemmataceae bacterium]